MCYLNSKPESGFQEHSGYKEKALFTTEIFAMPTVFLGQEAYLPLSVQLRTYVEIRPFKPTSDHTFILSTNDWTWTILPTCQASYGFDVSLWFFALLLIDFPLA